MNDVTVLRTTKIGGGFIKEDVLQYLEELNEKINALQKENENFKNCPSASESYQVKKYQNKIQQLQSLNEKLYAEKIEMEYKTEYLRSLLDKANAELEKLKPAEKNSGVTLHRLPEETISDENIFRREVMESLSRIESGLLDLHMEKFSGESKE